jgi:hypothetical protein
MAGFYLSLERLVDDAGIDVVGQWIDGLQPAHRHDTKLIVNRLS